MTLVGWLFLLLIAGVVLLIAELILPTHGLIGALGVLCLLASVGVCFRVNEWASLGLLVGLMAATPFAWSLAVKIWPKTPVGRRVVLPQIDAAEEPLEFQIGQQGISLSELRPMGECRFGDLRLQARSESGIILAGTRVLVVSADGRVPTVRPLGSEQVES